MLESARLPDHAPEATQELASVDDQVSVEDPPLATDVGFAVRDTVGAGGGAGVSGTATVAEALAPPPGPVQLRENALELVNAPLGSLPEIALLPDHAPEATQEAASVDDQLSVEDSPLATDVGFADSDTVGIRSTVMVVEALVLPPGPVQVRE